MRYAVCLVPLLALLTLVAEVRAHGVPIKASVVGGKIQTDFAVYETDLSLVGGVLLFTDLPGIEVPLPAATSGFATNKDLKVTVKEKLLYFNGTDVVPTPATLTIENALGATAVVSDSTGVLPPLFWGKYSGAAGWHQHSDYIVSPSSADEGLYGLVFCIEADGYNSSDPILIAFNYGLSDGAAHEGIEAFEAILNPVPEPASFVLASTGLVGLVVLRRKFRRS